LSDWLDRASRLYTAMGARVLRSKPSEIRWPSGAVIRTGHLNDDQAYTKYQGHEYHKILFEELTQIPSEKQYLMVISSCRSTVPGLAAKVFCTTNPGGVGHRWVMNRWGVKNRKPRHAYPISPEDDRLMMFIPARVQDTPQLMVNDPNYVSFLQGLPTQLRKAWYEGDWSAFEGQMFDFGDVHILPENLTPPPGTHVLMTFDYGFGKPFSVGYWFQEGSGEQARLVRFDEIYGARKSRLDEDVGLRLDDDAMADMILTHEVRLGLGPEQSIVRLGGRDIFSAKPDYFARAGGGQGPSSAEVFQRRGLVFLPGDDRSRMAKVRRFHQALAYRRDPQGALISPPKLVVCPRCDDFIRTIPELVSDSANPEDIDTRQEDHVYDEACHAVMYRWPDGASAGGAPVRGRSAWARAATRYQQGGAS
jgi:hypothetical protein